MKPLLAALALGALPAGAQTLKPAAGNPYAWIIVPTLACQANPSTEAGKPRPACSERAISECAAKSGVYEACLEAVAKAQRAARLRVAKWMAEAEYSSSLIDAVIESAPTPSLDPGDQVLEEGKFLFDTLRMLETTPPPQGIAQPDAQLWAKLFKGLET